MCLRYRIDVLFREAGGCSYSQLTMIDTDGGPGGSRGAGFKYSLGFRSRILTFEKY